MRLASPNPCCGPIASSVRNTMRSSVPCSTSFGILKELAVSHLECQHECGAGAMRNWPEMCVRTAGSPWDNLKVRVGDGGQKRVIGEAKSVHEPGSVLPGRLVMPHDVGLPVTVQVA